MRTLDSVMAVYKQLQRRLCVESSDLYPCIGLKFCYQPSRCRFAQLFEYGTEIFNLEAFDRVPCELGMVYLTKEGIPEELVVVRILFSYRKINRLKSSATPVKLVYVRVR